MAVHHKTSQPGRSSEKASLLVATVRQAGITLTLKLLVIPVIRVSVIDGW